jgi:hypothetical protein
MGNHRGDKYEKGFQRCILSEEDKQFIRDNHLTMPVLEIMRKLNKHQSTVYQFMGINNLKTLDRSKLKIKKRRAPEGYFDVHEKDWVVG